MMSKKLALSSALSVMLMAGFALYGERVADLSLGGGSSFALPGKIELPGVPALPQLPGLR